jgi:hypothetical protein
MRVVVLVLIVFIPSCGCARKAEIAYADLSPTRSYNSASAALVPTRMLAESKSSLRYGGSRSRPSETDWNTSVVVNAIEKPENLFDKVQAKAEKVGVENLTQADIQGLSYEQIQKLRGY